MNLGIVRDVPLKDRPYMTCVRVFMRMPRSDGLSNQEIAEQINLSTRTVEWYMHQAMRKLGAKNRVQAVVLAIRNGVINV